METIFIICIILCENSIYIFFLSINLLLHKKCYVSFLDFISFKLLLWMCSKWLTFRTKKLKFWIKQKLITVIKFFLKNNKKTKKKKKKKRVPRAFPFNTQKKKLVAKF